MGCSSRRVLFPLPFVAFALASPAAAQRDATGTDAEALRALGVRFARDFERERIAALAWAASTGQPVYHAGVGGVLTLVGIRDGIPVFEVTNNAVAAQTISTDELWPGGASGYNLAGNGVTLHLWDGAWVRTTHVDLNPRVTQMDAVPVPAPPALANDHATHVAGTMVADAGLNLAALGMAFQANLNAYDLLNDNAEMTAAAAGVNGARVSNHSYGTGCGWFFGSTITVAGVAYYPWLGYVNNGVATAEDGKLGLYDAAAAAWDQIAFDARSYLICQAAGNDRGNFDPNPAAPPVNGNHVHLDLNPPAPLVPGWQVAADAHPIDGGATGYDTIPTKGCAKNVLTVGAVDDIPGGYVNAAGVTQAATSFSGWGPTDDGRIKPDLVANGHELLSAVAWQQPLPAPPALPVASDTERAVKSGTSMAAPSVSGSLGLLIQHHRVTHPAGLPDMRASSLKALAIHSCDEAGGAAGPDYSFGWGLFNAKTAADQVALDAVLCAAIDEVKLEQGKQYLGEFWHPGSASLKITLCWTDPPGAAEPSTAVDPPGLKLVNDLDLRVTKPVVVQPWILDPANPGNAATTGDNTRDNVEQVVVAPAPANMYRYRVSHKGVLQNAPQEYSIILPLTPPPGKGVKPGVIGANPAHASPPGLLPATVGAATIDQVNFVDDPALPSGFVRCALSTNLGLRTGVYSAAADILLLDPVGQWGPLNVSGDEFGLMLNGGAGTAGVPAVTYAPATVAVWDFDVDSPASVARCAVRANSSASWTLMGPITGVPAGPIDPALGVIRGELHLLWVEADIDSIVAAPFDPSIPALTGDPVILVSTNDHEDLRHPHSPTPVVGPDGDMEALVYNAALNGPTLDSVPYFKPTLDRSTPSYAMFPTTDWSNNGGLVGGTLYQAYVSTSSTYHVYDTDVAILTGDDETHTRGSASRSVDVGLRAPIVGIGGPTWIGIVFLDATLLPVPLPIPPYAGELALSPTILFALPAVPGATGRASIPFPVPPSLEGGPIHVQGFLIRVGPGGFEGGFTNNAYVYL